ncbi:(2Fe-2S)-binding protein [Paenibacillus sp. J31TS4]|nr:(2Fe-2S)-binding protein [Paenibacillus sp. J31TS4]
MAKKTEIQENKQRIFQVQGLEIGLYCVEGRWFAWRNVCPHQGAPICKGRVCGTRLPSLVYQYEYGMEERILRCPWHGWEFDLTTGEHLVDSGTKLRGYEVVCEGEDLFVVFP